LWRRILNAAEAEDITLGQASVLTHLSGKQGVTVSKLTSAEGMRHQSMTATVASLTALVLVERRLEPR
jgi:DNA-binding MarR family transcriptional regulator